MITERNVFFTILPVLLKHVIVVGKIMVCFSFITTIYIYIHLSTKNCSKKDPKILLKVSRTKKFPLPFDKRKSERRSDLIRNESPLALQSEINRFPFFLNYTQRLYIIFEKPSRASGNRPRPPRKIWEH